MKRWLIGLVIGLVVVTAGGYAIYRQQGGLAGIVGAALPEFPDWPPPADRLASGQQGHILFHSDTPFDLDVLLGDSALSRPTTAEGTLYLPDAASPASPVPAMVLLHGSGGLTPGREGGYAELLTENGYAAFVLNYYTPRGVTEETPYMVRVLSTTEFDAITDAYRALQILHTHPDIDATRIGIMGFSYGGMAARFAMDGRIKQALIGDEPGFAAHVDYYGPCFQNLRSPSLTGAPILTLRGTEDASNDLAACVVREAELRRGGVDVEAHVYEGAGHAWEANRPRSLIEEAPYVTGCEVVYDERGHSFMGDTPIVSVPIETSREERVALRIASGRVMADCVKSGYVIGRDDDTKSKSDAHLLGFLGRVLGGGG
ncbi:MAG: dienelactone hydrolase [bacterium]|nr:dienelactone hydrolase [bacterium]